jgi:ribosomal protein S18 acetylase RimI-like enzyme
MENVSLQYKIENTIFNDLPFIYWIFEEAMAFHSRNNYPVWNGYDKDALQHEVKEGLEHKIVIEDKIALVFSAIYSDPVIWREMDKDDSVFLHRIAVNPEFRGMKLFGEVFKWSINDAISKGRKYVRLDTWGDNPNMIAYYQSFGFRFVENFSTGDDPALPSPHRNMYMALLEYEIK